MIAKNPPNYDPQAKPTSSSVEVKDLSGSPPLPTRPKKINRKISPVDPPINQNNPSSSGSQASVTDSSGSVSLSDVVGLGMIAAGIDALSSDNTQETTVANEDLAEAFEAETVAIELDESSSDNDDGGGGGPGMGSSDDGGGGGGGGGGGE
jgi:hypothetical protein